MKTLKNFIDYCGESLGALVRPVKNQMGCDVTEFWQHLNDVSRSYCGAAAGFTGFIYYSETVAFWRKNRKAITACMEELADDLGENLLQMVSNFNGFKGVYTDDELGRALYGNYNSDYDQIYNGFAWFALEEVANRYADYDYENR